MSESPKPKLSRPDRPCDSCRKRKSRCVFEDDSAICFLCKFHNFQCEFNLPPLQKKKKKNETSPTKPPKQSKVPVVIPTLHNYYLGGNNEFDGVIFKDLLPNPEIDLNPVGSRYVIKRKIRKQAGDLFLEVEGSSEDVEYDKQQIQKINEFVGDSGPGLVSLYFRFVHGTFPIISEKNFLENYKKDINLIDPCLLACLYLFALNWWSLSLDLSGLIQPSQNELEKIAETIFYKKLKTPTLSTIQAGLLLIQHQSFRDKYDNPSNCWPIQSALWGAAQCLGLNRDPCNYNIPEWEKSLRKRISWAIYVQEKWFCITVDKSSHINDDDWTVGDLDEFKDFTDSESHGGNNLEGRIDESMGIKLFLEKIELSKLADVILKELCSLKSRQYFDNLENSDPVTQLKSILNKIKPLQIHLTNWESQLPKVLLIEQNIERGLISGAPNIYISNFSAQITILRPVLRLLSKIKNQQKVVDREFMGIRDIVFNRCVIIFENILRFVNELKAEHLQTFWYTSARVGFSYIVIFGYYLALISKNSTEYNRCIELLENYVWKLKINNKNAEFFLHSILWWSQLNKLLKNVGNHGYNFEEETLSEPEIMPASVPTGNFLLPHLFNLDSIEDFIMNFHS